MKKTYISPETLLATTELQQLITASNNYGSPELGQNLGNAETTDAVSGNLSRRSIWDDETSD